MVARVNGTLHDLDRPLESDAILEFVDFNSRDGQAVSIKSLVPVCFPGTVMSVA